AVVPLDRAGMIPVSVIWLSVGPGYSGPLRSADEVRIGLREQVNRAEGTADPPAWWQDRVLAPLARRAAAVRALMDHIETSLAAATEAAADRRPNPAGTGGGGPRPRLSGSPARS